MSTKENGDAVSNVEMTDTDVLVDRRNLPIISFHSNIDDMGLSPNAIRVYVHLARCANAPDCLAWPSYRDIGKVCFGMLRVLGSTPISESTATRFAIEAIGELRDRGLIRTSGE